MRLMSYGFELLYSSDPVIFKTVAITTDGRFGIYSFGGQFDPKDLWLWTRCKAERSESNVVTQLFEVIRNSNM